MYIASPGLLLMINNEEIENHGIIIVIVQSCLVGMVYNKVHTSEHACGDSKWVSYMNLVVTKCAEKSPY